MKVGSLFAGIGGFDLAARWMGWETAWFSEIDPYCSKVLARHWPGVPNHGDITKIDFRSVEWVDMLCGGFPCQDLSVAGKRKGLSGERSGLWSEYARAIRELRPRWVVIENVPPLLTSGFAVVRSDLRNAGYRVARPVLLSASAVGAPHLRERCWIVAHACGQPAQYNRGLGELDGTPGTDSGTEAQRERIRNAVDGGRADVADADSQQAERASIAWCERDPWESEPNVGRVAHGFPALVHRLRGLGNAIVPHCALHIFRAIQAAEERLVA